MTGCYAQRAPEEIAALPGVTQVIGNSDKHRLAEIAVPDLSLSSALPFPAAFSFPAQALSFRAERGICSSELPNTSKNLIPLTALTENRELRTENSIIVSDIFAHTELLAAPVFDAANDRTRPNLKVQDGCDNRCSFCIIPYVRGQSRSLPLAQVIGEVNTLVSAGYREVVISGINLGRWGRDLVVRSQSSVVGQDSLRQRPTTNDQRPGSSQRPKTKDQRLSFIDLVRAILAETDLEKLRISSVEPMDWSDQLIELVASSPRIAKHAHVPMQSGSDRVLRAMHRKYRPWHYREKIEKIRAAVPTAAIGADVMVGFPGESDADFEQTRRMVEELPFTYLHVFTYSSRPGTPAVAMPNPVPVHHARERNRVLRELANAKKLAFMRSFVGKLVKAITLNVSDGERTEALTDNYLKVRLAGTWQANQWISTRVQSVVDGQLIGEPSFVCPDGRERPSLLRSCQNTAIQSASETAPQAES